MSKKKRKVTTERYGGKRERERKPKTHLLRGDKGCLCCPNAVTEIMAKQWQRGLILYQHAGRDSPPSPSHTYVPIGPFCSKPSLSSAFPCRVAEEEEEGCPAAGVSVQLAAT